jgi:hypothetical protein
MPALAKTRISRDAHTASTITTLLPEPGGFNQAADRSNAFNSPLPSPKSTASGRTSLGASFPKFARSVLHHIRATSELTPKESTQPASITSSAVSLATLGHASSSTLLDMIQTKQAIV